jgi:predicted TIM-barrel fold metal-dependent hydrolase
VKEVLGSFYYDLTSGTSNAQLLALLELIPTSQILMGVDIPFLPHYTIGEAIKAVGSYPGFTDADLELIAHGNATRLYPELGKRLGL